MQNAVVHIVIELCVSAVILSDLADKHRTEGRLLPLEARTVQSRRGRAACLFGPIITRATDSESARHRIILECLDSGRAELRSDSHCPESKIEVGRPVSAIMLFIFRYAVFNSSPENIL